MAKHYLTVICKEEGCNERSHYEYNNRKDYKDAIVRHKDYKCSRHSDYGRDRLMSVDVTVKEKILINTKSETNGHLFWTNENGKKDSGYQYGPGFHLWSKDFPEGTILKVTAEITLPNSTPELLNN